MATASHIIQRAMRIAGVNLVAGRSFADSTSQMTEALDVLNALLGTLRLQSLTWYSTDIVVKTLTPGLNPHTVGVGGDLDTPRPVQIIEMYLRYLPSSPDVDLKLIQLTMQQYAEISAKPIESQIPQYAFYNPTYDSHTDPKGALYLWMVPNQANDIVLYVPVVLTEPATLSTQLLLPPGYPRMLEYNLAVEFAALYRKRFNDARADAAMVQAAKESLYWVKVNNAKPLDIQSDPSTWGAPGFWLWQTGNYRWQ